MKWITRERPKMDHIASTRLIARFVVDASEFLHVPAGDVMQVAAEASAPANKDHRPPGRA
jgi:hypothetical protein